MESNFKLLFALVGFQTLVSCYFIYRYSGIEYGIQTNTDIMIRKLISIENSVKSE